MNLAWLNPINKVLGLIGEAVEDKDKANELRAQMEMLKEQAYMMELQTKTVPWIDGLHKMGRQLLSWAMLIIPAILLWKHPDINPAVIAAMATPGGIYNYVKGKGK